jgi:hypothetical protein
MPAITRRRHSRASPLLHPLRSAHSFTRHLPCTLPPVGAGLPAKNTAAHHRPIASKLAPAIPVGAGLPAKRTAACRRLIASTLALTTPLWEAAPARMPAITRRRHSRASPLLHLLRSALGFTRHLPCMLPPVGAGLPAKNTAAHHRPIASKLAPAIPVGAGLPAKNGGKPALSPARLSGFFTLQMAKAGSRWYSFKISQYKQSVAWLFCGRACILLIFGYRIITR